jgi:ribosome-binding protein aMBF1 (putative translation factor)
MAPVYRFNPSRLRAARERAGLSREALARRIGRSAASIHAYELGNACPHTPVVGILAAALEVTPAAFFSREPADA